MRNALFPLILLALGVGPTAVLPLDARGGSHPGQGADLGFNANVARPAYPNSHPKVLFDEAHNNTDTSGGRYKPFADQECAEEL